MDKMESSTYTYIQCVGIVCRIFSICQCTISVNAAASFLSALAIRCNIGSRFVGPPENAVFACRYIVRAQASDMMGGWSSRDFELIVHKVGDNQGRAPCCR